MQLTIIQLCLVLVICAGPIASAQPISSQNLPTQNINPQGTNLNPSSSLAPLENLLPAASQATLNRGSAELGIRVLTPSEQDRVREGLPVRRGALVVAVKPGLAADQAGLPVGALIIRMDRRFMNSADDLVAEVRRRPAGHIVELDYYVGDRLLTKSIRLQPVATTGPSVQPARNTGNETAPDTFHGNGTSDNSQPQPTKPHIVNEPPLVERFLIQGRLAYGQQALSERLGTHTEDDQSRFGLGVLQFLQAIERLGQSLHHFGGLGATSQIGQMIPLLRLPVPSNPDAVAIDYDDLREILKKLIDDLMRAEATLAEIKDAGVKLPLHFGLIALDLNSDGVISEGELLWHIYAGVNRGLQLNNRFTGEQVGAFVITFDFGDVHWLRGYCHLLSAIAEAMLAYDMRELFDTVAPYLFAKPASPAIPKELALQPNVPPSVQLQFPFLHPDFIAAIHLIRFEVKEPQRLQAAWEHLREVIRLSRESWKAIQAENDNDQEWLPNSKQTGVIPNVRVTMPMIASWHEFLDEADQLLQGKKLVPHWRLNQHVGINLRRVFEQPREFDLVLWFHGAAAVPYIESGPVSGPGTWQRLQQVFAGQFLGFAFWFN